MSLQQVLEDWKQKPLNKLLTEMYIDRDLSIPAIADELHISVGVVHKYLVKLGINKQNSLWK